MVEVSRLRRSMWFRCANQLLILGVMVGFGGASASASADEFKDRRKAIEADLRAHFKLPKKYNLFDPRSVVLQKAESSVCIVRKQPIVAKMIKDDKDMSVPLGVVEDGKIVAKGGGELFNKLSYRDRLFRVGEQVYVADLGVNENDFWIMVKTLEVQKDVGRNWAARMRGGLRFMMPMQEATTETVLKAIEPFIVIADEAGNAPPPTVTLGQTAEEVIALLGNPQRIVDLGAKKIYVYADMKVIFQDGKVSDVQ